MSSLTLTVDLAGEVFSDKGTIVGPVFILLVLVRDTLSLRNNDSLLPLLYNDKEKKHIIHAQNRSLVEIPTCGMNRASSFFLI